MITAAGPEELARPAAIDLAAARLLVGCAPEAVLSETTSCDVLRSAQRDGRLLVAFAGDERVGFAHIELIERDAVHLEEIDIHHDHGRRGVGTRLVVHVCAWGASHESVTLMTFRGGRGTCHSTHDSDSLSFLPSSSRPLFER